MDSTRADRHFRLHQRSQEGMCMECINSVQKAKSLMRCSVLLDIARLTAEILYKEGLIQHSLVWHTSQASLSTLENLLNSFHLERTHNFFSEPSSIVNIAVSHFKQILWNHVCLSKKIYLCYRFALTVDILGLDGDFIHTNNSYVVQYPMTSSKPQRYPFSWLINILTKRSQVSFSLFLLRKLI